MMVLQQKILVVFWFVFSGIAFYYILGLFSNTIAFVDVDKTMINKKVDSRGQKDVKFRHIYGAVPEAANYSGFKIKLTRHETQVYMELLNAFIQVIEKQNLTYWIYSGSLLGSHRHHGIVPWDDDIDVTMPKTQMKESFQILNSLQPNYRLFKAKQRWKLYSHKSKKIRPGIQWKFPFLDISFYETEGDVIRDLDSNYKKFVFRYRDIFPLRKRPFQGLEVYAPQNVEKVLSATYDKGMCQGNRFIHKQERFTKTKPPSVNCTELMAYYPFVFRTNTPEGVNETLQLNGEILAWWLDKV